MPSALSRGANQHVLTPKRLSRHNHRARKPAMTSIRIYRGDGAGSRSVLSAVDSFCKAVRDEIGVLLMSLLHAKPEAYSHPGPIITRPHPAVQVTQIGPEELLHGGWQSSCLALVMPGGADLPYCRRLNGRGNQLIRGGALPTICISAQWASEYCFAPLPHAPAAGVQPQTEYTYIRAATRSPSSLARVCGGGRSLHWLMCRGLLCQLLC